ncbi:hypothetical protein [Sphingobium sp. EP60837]|uniref:hypothetical protein n=1 Tax=Sphingobium sp. EP60837 TaxID=1855519 RepID=UPI0007DE3129|nr:hypothetical protein [Sphingobium sp. EP60837]ANI79044.1 hypothetical protein EP837_02649 [Sphingobium sp. EP60837]
MSTYADLIVGLQQSAKAFRENTVYDSEGDPLRLIVQADENDAAADAISRLEREKAVLVGLVETAFSIINHTGVAAYLSARNLPLFCTAMDWVGEVSPLLSRTQEPPHAHKDA